MLSVRIAVLVASAQHTGWILRKNRFANSFVVIVDIEKSVLFTVHDVVVIVRCFRADRCA